MYRSWKAFKAAWIKALRSGEYRQGTNALCTVGSKSDKFCCLGVAANLLIEGGHKLEWVDSSPYYDLFDEKKYRSKSRFIGMAIPGWLKARMLEYEDDLINLNDNGHRFSTIAKYIEGNIK